MIKKLDNKSIQNICANQVILDISASVKELVENSLDAGSTVIEINLKDFGQESIIVKDNGHGISKSDFTTIIQKGATSKLSTFDDLNIISSYGFRGEALNALNQISDLTIITRTREENYGYKLKFDKNNVLILQEEIASDYGTTVILEKIYQNFPVRLLDLKSNLKSNYTKILALIMEYSLIALNTKIILFNETKEKPKEMILNNGNCDDSLSNRILKVLGKKVLDSLIEFECKLTETFTIKGFLMKNINSGSGKENLWLKKNLLYFYLNRRPINPPKKFQNVLAEIYKQYNSNSKFIAILNFELNNEDVDYNLSPDKREIYLQNEKNLVETFKNEVNSFHEKLHSFHKSLEEVPKTQSRFSKKSSIKDPSFGNTEVSPIDKRIKLNENDSALIKGKISLVQSPLETQQISYKMRLFEPKGVYSNSSKEKSMGNSVDEPTEPEHIIKKYSIKFYEPKSFNSELLETTDSSKTTLIEENIAKNQGYTMKIYEKSLLKTEIKIESEQESQIKFETNDDNIEMSPTQKMLNDENDMNNNENILNKRNYSMKIYQPQKSSESSSDVIEKKKIINLETLEKNEKLPEISLNETENDMKQGEGQKILSFTKENFTNLQIIGQFNMGFIIAYFQGSNDIFIIDQHAADEKSNYERLIREYKFESQMLINPLNLSNLTDIDLHTIRENSSIFEQNGFSLIFKQAKNEENSNELFLKALPCFKNVQFNLDDFYELLKNIHNAENSSNDLIRPGKFKSSIAYKACRGSVMVGDCLDKKEMKGLLCKLSGLKSPWNCPHGRPTMIKSESLSEVLTKIKVKRPEIEIKLPS